ncbi:TetR family transcriptional regulator (plasmid) [Nostoc carneum NIES-2107]|nr:TetR family transcriptional regulator [Nostoc carneum NIES-2107]
MPKETYIPFLLQLFRQYGYDGTTLSKISEATGLGKASLYHHFPGGKDEMVNAVLSYLEQWLEQNILQDLRIEGDALTRFQKMSDHISKLYEGGKQPCLFAILLMGSARDVFHTKLQTLLHTWIDAIAEVLIAAGLDETLAKQRGEDAAIAIQGSLILSHGLNDFVPFQRIVKQLPEQLCQDLGT